MKNLRLVFSNVDGQKVDIICPMEEWIADWWFECNIVPSNDTAIIVAELDGKSILNDINAVDERYKNFEEIAWHFNWDGLYDDFIGAIKENSSIGNNSKDFIKWITENVK